MHGSQSSWPPRLATLSGLAACAAALTFGILAHQPLPSDDYWVFLGQRGMGGSFAGVWGQNEYHIMLLPRVIFVLDELAGWTGPHPLTFAIAVISLATIALAGAKAIADDIAIRVDMRRPLAAVVAGLVFSATHIEVMAEPQKLWIPLALAGCILSLLLNGLSCRRQSIDWIFAVAMTSAVGASLSGIVGVLFLPVLVLQTLFLGGGAKRLAGVAATAILAVYLVFSHMSLPSSGNELHALAASPISTLLALGRFFGAPLARILGSSPLAGLAYLAAAVGLVGCGLAGWLCLAVLRQSNRSPAASFWVGILVLAAAWGGSVSLRDASGPGLILSRYDLIVSLFWAALLVLVLRDRPRVAKWGLPILAVALLLIQLPFGLRAIAQSQVVAAMRVAMAVGVVDPAIDGRKGYTAVMKQIRPLLLARELAPFDGRAARELDMAKPPASDETPCATTIDEVAALPDGGARIMGRGPLPPGDFPLIIVDAEGRVAGLGERWHGPSELFGRQLPTDGWLAYVRPGTRPPLHGKGLENQIRCWMPVPR